MTIKEHNTSIINQYKRFITGEGALPNGMFFNDAIDFENNENVHDFIQWLFPIDTISAVNPNAPLICSKILDFVASNEDASNNILRAVQSFEKFLLDHNKWPSLNDHNNRRISRVLNSLRLFNLRPALYSFYKFLLSIKLQDTDHKKISIVTMDHWRSAVFNRQIFVCIENSKVYDRVKTIILDLLPNHSVVNLEKDKADMIIALNEPVLSDIIGCSDTADVSCWNRGLYLSVDLLFMIDNIELVNKIRHWY